MKKPKWFSWIQSFYAIVGIIGLLAPFGIVWADEITFFQKLGVAALILFGISSLVIAKSLAKFTKFSLKISLVLLLIFISVSLAFLIFTTHSSGQSVAASNIQLSFYICLLIVSTLTSAYVFRILTIGLK